MDPQPQHVQYTALSLPLCRELLAVPELPSRLLVLAQLKEIASRSSGVQLQIIKEGCIPPLVASMDEGCGEEKILATTIIMRCALLGSDEIVSAGGVLPLLSMLKSGSEQTLALSVQTLWLILLTRKHHELVASYGGMQLLIALVKKNGVMDAVKDLASQALYMLWSEDVADVDSKKCSCLTDRSLFRKVTLKVLNHSADCVSSDTYTLQPALLNVFWLVQHLGDDVIQASAHEFGLQMITTIWMNGDSYLTSIALDILSVLLTKGMVPSTRRTLLLSLLPSLAQGGDAKIQEKIHFCAQFDAKKEIDRARDDVHKNLQYESLLKEGVIQEQRELIVGLRRQLAERESILNDFIQNHKLAGELRKLEIANQSDTISEIGDKEKSGRVELLEAQLAETTTKLQAANKRNKESKQKVKKLEERVRQVEKLFEVTSNEQKINKCEQNEKQLQAQLQQSKLIQLHQQKKLQQLCGVPVLEGDKATPSPEIGAKFKDSKDGSKVWSEANMICPICMEQTKNVSLDGCGHTLCKGCATMILHTPNKKCPMCRRTFKTANPFFL